MVMFEPNSDSDRETIAPGTCVGGPLSPVGKTGLGRVDPWKSRHIREKAQVVATWTFRNLREEQKMSFTVQVDSSTESVFLATRVSEAAFCDIPHRIRGTGPG